jgi:hypothetical protein
MDGGGGEGGGEKGRRRPRGEVDGNNDDDNDSGGPSPRTRRRCPLAGVRGDDGTIEGLLEAHHR